VPNEGDAWHYTLDVLHRYFVQVLTQNLRSQAPSLPGRSFLDLMQEELPKTAQEMIGPFVETVRLMGRRTAELHRALASSADDPNFAPEPFTMAYQRSIFQTVRSRTLRLFELLREKLSGFSGLVQEEVRKLLEQEGEILSYLHKILEQRISAQRIRCHGDYRLNNLVYTGKDFVVVDFEGEAFRPISNRRRKRSALRDVASLLHSFYFAVRWALQEGNHRPEDLPALEPWARYWHVWVSVVFMSSYLEGSAGSAFLPPSRQEIQLLLDFYLLSRSTFELGYQIVNHPDRTEIPLRGLLHLLELRRRRQEPEM
jgi:maltose alpha-D-glucosyltransferase/alpha-amylase